MPGFCWWIEQKGNLRFCIEVKEGIKGPERLRSSQAGALESVPWGGCRSWRAVWPGLGVISGSASPSVSEWRGEQRLSERRE